MMTSPQQQQPKPFKITTKLLPPGKAMPNCMDLQRLRRIQDAVCLVNARAQEAAAAEPGDRDRAYRLLLRWATTDTILDDALNSVGLLMTMKEDLEERGKAQQASSIDLLLGCEPQVE